MTEVAHSRLARIVDEIEETLIALLLAGMTLVTFANVIARYVFNSNLLWALETTVFLFAWLGLIGASYCVKTNAHLGVDVLVAALPARLQKAVTLLAVAVCLVFCGFMLYGAWTYWLPFVGQNAFYEVEDIRMPGVLQFFAHWLNDGEPYEKLPRFIPYFALPLGMTLITFRFLQVGWRVLTERQSQIVASHEVEEMLEEATSAHRVGRADGEGHAGGER